jgi:formiminotetrahydrofolate cyclodeaminase
VTRPFLELTVAEWLDTLAAPEPFAASGSAAAMTAATAAAVIALTARATQDGGGGIAAQALALRGRLVGLAEWDADAYGASVAALAAASGGGDARRDFALRSALDRAAEVPLTIAETAADVALLATAAARVVSPEVEADAQAAAALAAGAAAAAARLVEVNLSMAEGDERVRRARAAATQAATAAREAVPADSLQSPE